MRKYKTRIGLTKDLILSTLRYEPESGNFYWVNCARAYLNGTQAGHVDKASGHRFIRIGDVSYPASRLAWVVAHGELPDRPLRFLDDNPLNTRIANLTTEKAMPKGLNLRTPEGRRAHRKANPNYYRGADLRKKFGIDLADYQAMFVAQKGCCAICEKPETKTRGGQVKWLAVDHDHDTGEVRGLLCQSCNLMMGHAGDEPQVLSNAIAYLDRAKARRPVDPTVVPFRRV